MAVTKIRKISSWTLLITCVISVIVLGMFFFGGVVDPSAENKEYVYTDLLLQWTWLIFGVTIVVLAVLALGQFISTLKTNPKSALSTLGVFVLFALLLVVTYSMGDATPLQGINADSQAYNTEGWLKTTDMWIMSTCVLLVAFVVVVVVGAIKKIINK